MVLTVISVAAVLWVGETRGRNLHVEEIEGEQAESRVAH